METEYNSATFYNRDWPYRPGVRQGRQEQANIVSCCLSEMASGDRDRAEGSALWEQGMRRHQAVSWPQLQCCELRLLRWTVVTGTPRGTSISVIELSIQVMVAMASFCKLCNKPA